MGKIHFKNRKGQRIVALVDRSQKNQQGLVFVTHGLGGYKEQDHIKTFADAFKEEGFTVVRFDATNAFGESDGKYENATTTNYFEDLEDVISWSSTQDWYTEPFWLAGHSLGGLSIILFAEKFPDKVKAIAPISTVVSGKLSLESPKYKKNEILKIWKENGWRIEKSTSRQRAIKKLKWSHMEDRLKYDVLNNIDKLTMPVLLIVGDQDDSTPLEHQQILFDAISRKKELHLIKNAPHTFQEMEHLAEIKEIFRNWIDKNKS